MKCEVFFFNNMKNDLSKSIKLVVENKSEYRIITDSLIVHDFLKKINIDSKTFVDLFPHKGSLANEIFTESKKVLEKYKHLFDNILYNDIKIFKGFESTFLIQLQLFSKVKKILEEHKDIIFIFEGFLPMILPITELASELGYKNDFGIGEINGSNINYIHPDEDEKISGFTNKFSIQKTTKFVKYSLHEKSFLQKMKIISRFFLRTTSLSINKFFAKHYKKSNLKNYVLTGIDKKIIKNNGYNPSFALFITTSREDLYLNPWYSIFNKFKENKLPYHIFTSDLVTSMILSGKKIPHINLFEEVNILTNYLKENEEGEKILAEFENIIQSNSSVIGLKELSGFLLKHVFRSFAILIILKHVFSKMKFKSVGIGADGEMLENLAVKISKNNNIPSYSIFPGVIDYFPIFSDRFHADKIFMYGEDDNKILVDLGYEKEKIINTGNPKYDFLKSLNYNESKLFLEKNHQIDSKKKLIVIGMSRWHDEDDVWMPKLIQFCNNNNFEIVIKVHPTYKTSHKGEGKIRKITEKCKNLHYKITFDIDLYSLISGSDLIITEYSMFGVEGALIDKPVITVNFSGKPFGRDHPERIDVYDASIYVDEYDSLEKKILEILNEKKHLEEMKKGRKKVVDKFNFKNDGNASERVFKILTRQG